MSEENIYTEEFQLQVLAEVIRNHNFASTVLPNLKETFFSKEWFSIIFKVLHAYMDKYKDIPPTPDTFINYYNDLAAQNKGIKVTNEVLKIVPFVYKKNPDGTYVFNSNPKFIHDRVNDFIRKLAVRDAVKEVINKLAIEEYDTIKDIIMKALSVGVTDLGTYLCDDAELLVERFKNSRINQDRIPTPVDDLNKWTNGGIGKQELFVVLAPPNRGKSLVMGNLAAWAFMNKRKVVYYTLEMSEDSIGVRLIQALGNLTQSSIVSNSVDALEKVKRLRDYISLDIAYDENGQQINVVNSKDIVLKYYTSKSCSVNTIYSHLALLEARGFIPDIIFVDYADLMTPTKRYMDKRNELSDIYTALRDLAVEKNIAVVTASQTNRGALQKEVSSIEDIAEDFGKVAIADIIISLNQLATEKTEGKMRIYIAKNRGGEADKTIPMHISYATMSMGLIATDSDVKMAEIASIVGKNNMKENV